VNPTTGTRDIGKAGVAVGAEPAVAEPDAESAATAFACRALDIVAGAALLVLLSPLFLVIAIAIRIDSRGWAIFRQERLGRGRRPFTVNKFRTMHVGAGHDQHRTFVLRLITASGDVRQTETESPFYKMNTDARVTRIGRFLRKSSLDELPQLWNVVAGDMSLVGPRPPIRYEVDHYPPHWFGRFAVKPGMTGLWQVSGRSRLTLEEMIRLDLEYVRRRSVWLNLWILLRTIPAVLFARGAA
jgi:lipopolysaccharide/colanic/teichoic acid biosynthesis glycosyltransferase